MKLCSNYGNVQDAFIIRDKLTGKYSKFSFIGKSRGFGFVTFRTQEEADNAVEKMNGVQNEGRALRVNNAEEKR